MTPPMDGHVLLDVERFGSGNPAMNPALCVEHARVALGSERPSPVPATLLQDGQPSSALLQFFAPDSRSAATINPNTIIEMAAVVLAGLVLNARGKQLSHVAEIGSRVDYFVGDYSGDRSCILEVSGTWAGEIDALRQRKRLQLLDSPLDKEGFVAVTRFAEPVMTSLDRIPRGGGL
jgi:hypothetical protein